MLVLDAFRGHLSEELEVNLKRKNCGLVASPVGVTRRLQPLDVSVNKPFKGHLRKQYEAWLLYENLPLTQSGNIRRASASEPAERVSAAWKNIAGKQWNSRSRDAALQMHLMAQKMIPYGAILILTALI
jgi:hypothetical protein